MPDYNLGRAHGEVRITADVDDAKRGLGEYERATRSATDATREQSRIEQELTNRRREATNAAQRRKDAEAEFKRVMSDSSSTAQEQVRVEESRNRARGEHLQATRRAADAERAYRAALSGNDDAAKRFLRTLGQLGDEHDRTGRKLRDFRSEITQTGLAFREVGESISGTIGILSRVVGILAAGGAAGGLLGLLGAGGIQGVLAITEAIKDFSGAILLLPAGIAGAVTVIGTLAVAFQGVGDALGAMDDPAKFTEAVQKLAPAAAQAVTIIASFRDAIKGAMAAVQQSLFQPIVDQIQPLITTWLPALMQAGQAVANVLGQAGRAVAQWLQQPAQMQAFTTFIQNLVTGLNGLMPAIQPVLDAFRTLTVIGSQFFPQLAAIIVQIATAFNNWVQGAAQSGQLQAWIQTAISSFQQLVQSIVNVAQAMGGVLAAFEAAGSQGFLQWLVQVTDQFRAWVQSAQGTQILTDFFRTLQQASEVLGPILRIVGVAVLQLVNNLAQLGVSMGPGITTFFQSLADALNVLGQSLIASGPGLSTIIATIGRTLLEIVQQVGPQLPQMFQNLATAAVNLAPSLVSIAGALASILANLTPGEIEIILGIVAAFQAFSTVTPIIQAVSAAVMFLAANPIVLLVAAIVAAVVLIVLNWDKVKTAVQGVWDKLKEFAGWIGNMFANTWNSLTGSIKQILDNIANSFTNLFDQAVFWGKTIIFNLAQGLMDGLPGLRTIVDAITSILPDSWKQGSPAKRGPLAQMSTEEMGQRMVSQLATGISSGGPSVASAASGVAGGAAGAFTSAGSSGSSGHGFATGSSGFDQFIASLTQDLQSWHDLIANSFGLFQKITDIFVNTTKVVASLWNKGDNPLTQPGGIFGTAPGLTPEQQTIPGVQNFPQVHGKAPLPELAPAPVQGAPPVPQQSIPGVPAPPGATTAPGPPAAPAPVPPGPGSVGIPPPAPGTAGVPAGPAAVSNQVAATAAQGINTGTNSGTDISNAIIAEGRRRNMSNDQIRSALAIAQDESGMQALGFNTSGGNASVGGVGGVFQQSAQAGWGSETQIRNPSYSIAKFYDVYQENLRRFPGVDPLAVAILTQNPQLVTQYGVNPQDLVGGSEYGRQVAAATRNQPFTGAVGRLNALPSAAPAPAAAPIAAPPAPRPPIVGTQQPDTFLGGPGGPTLTGQEPAVDYTRGRFIRTADGKVVRIPEGADPQLMLQRFPGGTILDATQQPIGVVYPPAAPKLPPPSQRPGANVPAQPINPPAVAPTVYAPGVTPGAAPTLGPYGLPIGFGGAGAPIPEQAGLGPLSQFFAIHGTSYAGHQEGHGQNQGIDWWPQGKQIMNPGTQGYTREEADRLQAYAMWVGTQPGVEQVIYQNPYTGFKVGYYQGQPVGPDMPGTTDPGYYRDDFGDHTGHVHTRFTQVLGAPGAQGSATVPQPPGAPVSVPVKPTGIGIPQTPAPPGGPSATQASNAADWMRVPQGWDISQPIPVEVRRQHGIPDEFPPIYYSAQPGTVTNVTTNAPPGTTTPEGSIVSPGGTISVPLPGGAAGQPGFPATAQPKLPFNAKTPMEAFSSSMSAAGGIAGDALQIFNDIIQNIGATANMFDTLVRGFENTEDIMRYIDDLQTFITTAADVSKLVGDIGGLAGGASGGADMGAGAALQAVAGIVSSALEATNMAIDLGQEVWHQASKYGAIFAGYMLGGPGTGPLAGNVRMLLNTNTGQLQAYSEDNPQNKATHNLGWLTRAYGGANPNAQPNVQQNQVNIYTGPGQTPRDMMNESMWLVSTGGASVASVSGQD